MRPATLQRYAWIRAAGAAGAAFPRWSVGTRSGGAAMSLLRFILGGLLLPLRLYFKPYAFRAEVAALAPDLPEDYSLWRARRHLREPEFCYALLKLAGEVCIFYSITIFWVTIVAYFMGAHANWVSGAIFLLKVLYLNIFIVSVIAALMSLAAGIVCGVFVSLFYVSFLLSIFFPDFVSKESGIQLVLGEMGVLAGTGTLVTTRMDLLRDRYGFVATIGVVVFGMVLTYAQRDMSILMFLGVFQNFCV
jgi:hypothetical protein